MTTLTAGTFGELLQRASVRTHIAAEHQRAMHMHMCCRPDLCPDLCPSYARPMPQYGLRLCACTHMYTAYSLSCTSFHTRCARGAAGPLVS